MDRYPEVEIEFDKYAGYRLGIKNSKYSNSMEGKQGYYTCLHHAYLKVKEAGEGKGKLFDVSV
jgi:hypothetical protein